MGQMFNQNPLLFILQDYINWGRASFYFKVLPCDKLCQFDETSGKYTSQTHQVGTKPVFT